MPTALITGATSGIGAEFATELAARGYDLVLVARNQPALENISRGLAAAHNISVHTLPADLADAAQLARVEERLGEGVDLLINNAGFALNGRFPDNEVDEEYNLLLVNVAAVLRLTRAALPAMMARRSGGVINVSSIAGFAPMWRDSTYPASKAWVTNFSECVGLAASAHGVTVTAVCPGYTNTKFFERAGLGRTWVPGGFRLEPRTVVRAALRDNARGKLVSVPTLRYKAVALVLRFTPHWLLSVFALRANPHPES